MLLGFIGFIDSANAQCSPDAQYTQLGVWPAVMPVSCVNQAYDETVTLIYPNDSCVMVSPPNCTNIALTNATITKMSNLPPGLSHTCPNANCIYLPSSGDNTSSCIQISGTPTQAGTYTVVVSLALNSSFGAFNVDYDFEITINENGVGGCIATGMNDSSFSDELTVSPNPTNGLVYLNKTIIT